MPMESSSVARSYGFLKLTDVIVDFKCCQHSRTELRISIEDKHLLWCQEEKTTLKWNALNKSGIHWMGNDIKDSIKDFRIDNSHNCKIKIQISVGGNPGGFDRLRGRNAKNIQQISLDMTGQDVYAHLDRRSNESTSACKKEFGLYPDHSGTLILRFRIQKMNLGEFEIITRQLSVTLTERSSIMDQLGNSGKVITVLLTVAKPGTAMNSVAQNVLGALDLLFTKVKNQAECDAEIKRLLYRLQRMLRNVMHADRQLDDLEKFIKEFFGLLQRSILFIQSCVEEKDAVKVIRILTGIPKEAGVATLIKEFDVLSEDFNRNLALSNLHVAQHTLTDAQDAARQQKLKEITGWLSPLDYNGHQRAAYAQRYADTGSWLLASPEFLDWMGKETSKRVLWCHGIPGAGKTVFSSIIINHLLTTERSPSICVLSIYCKHGDPERQKAANLLGSLLKQLAQQYDSVFDAVEEFFISHMEKQMSPDVDELESILRNLLGTFQRAYIVVDALDECENREMQRLLASLRSLPDHIRVLCTSRMIQTIKEQMEQFDSLNDLQLAPDQGDMEKYVDGYLYSGTSPMMKVLEAQPTLISKKEIKRKLVKKAGGMMLLLQMHVQSLSELPTIKAIKKHLSRLPLQLDDKYSELVERIRSQPDHRQLAFNVIRWVTFALGPLDIASLRYAVAINQFDDDLDLEGVTTDDVLLSSCIGLVTVDDNDSTVRLVHESAYDYFRKRSEIFRLLDEHAHIARICITLLSFPIWIRAEDPACAIYQNAMGNFLGYASKFWGDHARIANLSKSSEVTNFLQKSEHVKFSARRLLPLDRVCDSPTKDMWINLANACNGQCLAAFFNLEQLLGKRQDPSSPADLPVWIFAALGRSRDSIEILHKSLITAIDNTGPNTGDGKLLRYLGDDLKGSFAWPDVHLSRSNQSDNTSHVEIEDMSFGTFFHVFFVWTNIELWKICIWEVRRSNWSAWENLSSSVPLSFKLIEQEPAMVAYCLEKWLELENQRGSGSTTWLDSTLFGHVLCKGEVFWSWLRVRLRLRH